MSDQKVRRFRLLGSGEPPLASFTLHWLAKTRCVVLKSSVFTRKTIGTPRKPCPGWQKPHWWCQSHTFSQSVRTDPNPVPPHVLPWHTQNRASLPTLCVFPIGSTFDSVLGLQKMIKKPMFCIGAGSEALFLCQVVANSNIIYIVLTDCTCCNVLTRSGWSVAFI